MKLRIRILVIACALSYVAIAQSQPQPLPREELQSLAATYQLLRDSFVRPLSGEEIVQAALRGMLKELDPEGGQFFTKEDLADSQVPADYQGGAVGLEMIRLNGEVVVVSPTQGSPAEKAGIRPNDVVYAVEGIPMNGNVANVSKMLRGPLNSIVLLTIRRPGEVTLRDFNVERKSVQGAYVHFSAPTPDIVVLRVTAFKSDTLMQIAGGLTARWGRQPYKGIVLDLRRNTGGLLDASIGMASLFLPPKSLVAEVKGRSPEASTIYYAEPEYYTKGVDPFATVPPEIRSLPLVVLVDEGTASGAEIVVAALRDHHRASVVGRKTFGRTSIQTYRTLGTDRAVKLTTAYWYPPSHEKLDKIGILPDRIVAMPDSQGELDAAIVELRKRLH